MIYGAAFHLGCKSPDPFSCDSWHNILLNLILNTVIRFSVWTHGHRMDSGHVQRDTLYVLLHHCWWIWWRNSHTIVLGCILSFVTWNLKLITQLKRIILNRPLHSKENWVNAAGSGSACCMYQFATNLCLFTCTISGGNKISLLLLVVLQSTALLNSHGNEVSRYNLKTYDNHYRKYSFISLMAYILCGGLVFMKTFTTFPARWDFIDNNLDNEISLDNGIHLVACAGKADLERADWINFLHLLISYQIGDLQPSWNDSCQIWN